MILNIVLNVIEQNEAKNKADRDANIELKKDLSRFVT